MDVKIAIRSVRQAPAFFLVKKINFQFKIKLIFLLVHQSIESKLFWEHCFEQPDATAIIVEMLIISSIHQIRIREMYQISSQ